MDITHDNVFFLYAFHFFRTTLFTMRPISSIKHREDVYNPKKSDVLCQFVSVTSGAQVCVLALFARTFKVHSK